MEEVGSETSQYSAPEEGSTCSGEYLIMGRMEVLLSPELWCALVLLMLYTLVNEDDGEKAVDCGITVAIDKIDITSSILKRANR